MKWNIKTKLFTAVGLTSFLIGILAIILLLLFSERIKSIVTESITNQINAQAETMAINAKAAIIFEDKETATEILQSYKKDPHITFIGLFLNNGELLAEYRSEERLNTKSNEIIARPNEIRVRKSIDHNNNIIGEIDFLSNPSTIIKELRFITIVGCIVLTILMLFGIFLTWKIQQLLLRPLTQLAKTAHKISQNSDYSMRVKITSNDELGELASNFNQMLTEIERRDSGQEIAINEKTQELLLLNKELKNLSTRDTLTNLLNRASFHNWVITFCEHYNETQKGFSLLCIDIDNFKIFNDTSGHFFGDNILKAVAERLTFNSEKHDLIFRWGSDEFMLILPDIEDSKKAKAIAKTLNDELCKPITIIDKKVEISCSIGIVSFPSHSKDAATLIRKGDIALCTAKSTGKNQILIFSNQMEDSIIEETQLLYNFRIALNNDYFKIFLQGIFDAQTSELISFETLSRWSISNKSIAPDVFIDCAEKNNLIRRYNNYVLNKACKIFQSVYPSNKDIKFSVNFSSSDIQDPKFINRIKQALSSHSLPYSILKIEITENTILYDTPQIKENLQALRELGITVQLDDFGKGYSSLSYMREYTVDAIKIDSQFIRNIENSQKDRNLVKVIISLKEIYPIDIIAEGVETVEQLDFLKSEGCDFIQGYYFHVPMQAEDALDTLLKNRKTKLNSSA